MNSFFKTNTADVIRALKVELMNINTRKTNHLLTKIIMGILEISELGPPHFTTICNNFVKES